MNWMKASCTLVVSLTAVLGASSAMALESCNDTKVCSKASDTCHGGVCVPKDRLCKTDAGCKGWQVCDMTCPGVSSSPTSGGGTSTPGSTGCASSDGDACSTSPAPSTDGGSSGGARKPKSDGGSSEDQAFEPDASGLVQPPDASQTPPCPKDQGICVPDLKKVTAQPGCAEFCKSVVTCDFLGGDDSGGGSGGSGGTEPSPPPPGPKDGGSSGAPQEIDAGSTGQDPMPDAGAKKMPSDAAGFVAPDAGPKQGDIDQCVQMCSVWKLEGVAQPEFTALAMCVAGKSGVCNEMELACKDAGDAFINAAKANDFWMIALQGSVAVGGSNGTGETKGADAVGTTTPQGSDVKTGGDAVANTGAASGSGNSTTSGCTAGPTANGTPWGLALLSLLGLGMVFRRRNVV